MESNGKILDKLLFVQQKLIAPKSQFNNFGKYAYRSAEDILIAVKPLLNEIGAVITIKDEVLQVGERYYVKATAFFQDISLGNGISVSAYAREDDEQKGMVGAQLTGSTSSYARKYALNGLLLIDDNKDADATNTHGKGEVYISEALQTKIKEKASDEEIKRALAEMKVASLNKLLAAEKEKFFERIRKIKSEQESQKGADNE